MGRLTFEPLIPASLWLLLAAVAVVLLAWYAASRPGRIAWPRWVAIVALMAAGLGSVLIVLLNPTWIDPVDPPPGKPLLTVLVDDSASMAVHDAEPGNKSRFEAARQTARKLASDLGGRFEVRTLGFSTELAPMDDEPAGAAVAAKGSLTDLAGALRGGVDAERAAGQAIVLLSDGIHNSGGGTRELLHAVRSARAATAPVYTLTLGRSDTPEVHDLATEIRAPHQLAYVGQQVPITLRVQERGGAGGPVEVSLLGEGRPVETQTVNIPVQGAAEATFTISEDVPGLYRYEARVEPRPGELIAVNNTAVQFLQIVNEPIRVLLLEGKPYWDGKFLMRTLAADPVVALDSVVRMAEGRFLRRSLGSTGNVVGSADRPEQPSDVGQAGRNERWAVLSDAAEILSDADALNSYQVVVLGRDTELFLSEAATTNLRRWISRQGGALVCYRGSPAVAMGQKLAQILPVSWSEGAESRFHVNLTEQGRSLRWLGDLDEKLSAGTLAQLPTLATVSRVDRPRPLATVLATAHAAQSGEEVPVISCQNYGTGRVVVIEGGGMWRWAFLPPQDQEYSAVYGSLWQSLVRWLVSGAGLRPGQHMDLRCERVMFESSEPAAVTLLLSEEAAAESLPIVELCLVGEGNPIGQFTPSPAGDDPGVFRAALGKLPPGQYEARVSLPPGTDVGGAGTELPWTRFDVRAPVREQLELAARPDLMKLIAEQSGGAVLEDGSAREVLGEFDAFTRQARPERVMRLPAWDRWYVLLAIFAIWATTWAVRRAGGLI